ncbi:aminotransferase class IV [Sulfurihydrogenibium yellowstonense]|jgi:Branched-chain amino acid aminotransferase/4-amino-4-deoxychorismate lyase|uniref:Aminotransferase, class IV n=1 Tax=Sulfurihydrogenibium yellowstonense SS-5 TaxID=432331 RepID=C4FLW3_9AQUI|nr:aminotransferase class IV [Sulfurihydrogenibium yellowstonense]EEP59939.1 aminotransferase, class IV [Sulfurihydrogenibium yellowstonense SS-5]
MAEKVFINGKELEQKNLIRPLMYGEGVFETFRYKEKLPKYIDYHFERLSKGCEILNIPKITKEDFLFYIEDAVSKSEGEDLYVKIIILSEGNSYFPLKPHGKNVMVITKPYEPIKEEIRLTVSPYKVHSSDPLLKIKSTNYLRNILIKRYARENGFFDCIILNENNFITETSSANIYWIKGRYLYTPSLDNGVLDGISRKVVLQEAKAQGFVVVEGRFTLKDIKEADLIFISNALHGLMKVKEINV